MPTFKLINHDKMGILTLIEGYEGNGREHVNKLKALLKIANITVNDDSQILILGNKIKEAKAYSF